MTFYLELAALHRFFRRLSRNANAILQKSSEMPTSLLIRRAAFTIPYTCLQPFYLLDFHQLLYTYLFRVFLCQVANYVLQIDHRGFLALLIRPRARAQTTNTSCFDEDLAAVNVTGSVQIAGLQPKVKGESETAGNWTISMAVKEILVPEDNTYVLQRFWLDTDPPVDIPATELNYTGCAFVLQGISPSKKLVGNNAGNSCQGVFDTACYNAIVDDISSNASSYAAVGEPNICASLSYFLLNLPIRV